GSDAAHALDRVHGQLRGVRGLGVLPLEPARQRALDPRRDCAGFRCDVAPSARSSTTPTATRTAQRAPVDVNLSSPLTLCYHGVSNTWDNALAVRPNAFEQQIRFLLRRRWRPATAQQVISGSGRLLHVTFDDAFTSILPSLVALRTLAVPATVFACSGYAEDGGGVFDVPELAAAAQTVPDELQTLGWDGLRDLAEAGVEIGS